MSTQFQVPNVDEILLYCKDVATKTNSYYIYLRLDRCICYEICIEIYMNWKEWLSNYVRRQSIEFIGPKRKATAIKPTRNLVKTWSASFIGKALNLCITIPKVFISLQYFLTDQIFIQNSNILTSVTKYPVVDLV